jgi:hypothetical protein
MTGMRRRCAFAVLVAALAAAGCLSPRSVPCSDGRFCPIGTECDVVHQTCVTAAEKAACANLAEGDSCKLNMLPGACRSGICQPFICGDGVRSGAEECDGSDLGGQTCSDLHFYGQTIGLACNADCTLDTTGCTGVCGDGIVNGPEECDGPPQDPVSCIPFGYDQGFVGCSASCEQVFDGCTKYGGWAGVATIQTSGGLSAVWGSGPDDVYAVGGSTVLHWDGNEWSATTRAIDPASRPSLVDVWGSGPSDVFAVGSPAVGPSIFHWDGEQWTAQQLPQVAVPGGLASRPFAAQGVWGSGPNDVYLVGDSIFHWDGSLWSSVYAADGLGVWGSGPNDVYVVGGKTVDILHWDGSVWSPMVAPHQSYTRVWGNGPNDVFAVGSMGVSHWDGTAWSLMDSGASGPLLGIWGTGADDVLALGSQLDPVRAGSLVDPAGSVILRWNGKQWTQDSFVPDSSLVDIWVDKGGSAFAVGADAVTRPLVVARSANVWTQSTFDGTPPVLNAVWGAGTEQLFAVGEGGTLAHWDRSGWSTTALDPTLPMRGVWGNGPDDVLAVGDNKTDDPVVNLAHWDGAGWSRPAALPTITLPGGLRAIWSSGPNDTYLVGESHSAGCVLHWNGTIWSPLDSVFPVHPSGPPISNTDPPPASAVWGTGANDVFVFHVDKLVYGDASHWDGMQWVAQQDAGGPVSVWGSSSNDVYAVRGDGNIAHWNGTSWWIGLVAIDVALWAVGGSSAGDVFAAGDDVLLHLRGGVWEQIALPVKGSVRGLWVTPSRVTLVGTMGELHLDRASVTCVGPERDCNDGWDNDCDGLADMDDPDCAGKVPEQCANKLDDDGDGLTDCADPDCKTFPNCKRFWANQ